MDDMGMDAPRLSRSRTPVAVGLALLAVLGTGATAVAADADLPSLPAVLVSDLSWAEENALDDATGGGAVTVGALVVEGSTAQVITLQAADQAAAERAVDVLAAQPSVLGADVDHVVTALLEDLTGQQWGNTAVRSVMGRTGLSAAALAEVTVAVLDTGVEVTHPDLAGATVPGFNAIDGSRPPSDVHGHGTHVAGTIAALAGNGGVEGVATGVRIMPVKVLGDNGSGSSSSVAAGITWAADNGADILNLSLGGGEDSLQKAAVQYARGKGVVVVAAAGNAGQTGSPPAYPAAFPGVIGVAATAISGERAPFSSFGSWVDIAGPGAGILSTYPGSRFVSLSGTSMATPHVAAVAALVKAASPALTPDQVEAALTSTATDAGTPGRDDQYGAGRVDAPQAVAAGRTAAGLPPLTDLPPGTPSPGTPAPSAGPTLLALTTTPQAVIGKPVSVVAVLASASSTALKGISATLEKTDASGAWVPLRTQKTGANGIVTFPPLKPTATAFSVRVVVPEQTSVSASLLSSVALPVVAPVSAAAPKLTTPRSGVLKLTSPAPEGVAFVVQDRRLDSAGKPVGDGAWHDQPGAPTVVDAAKGTVTVPVLFEGAGSWELRVVRPAGAVVGETVSASVRVRTR